MSDTLVYGKPTDPLRCPDCGTSFQPADGIVTCGVGHKPIRLAWLEVCKCGHPSHYDMTGFCLDLGDGCECTEYNPGEIVYRVVMRQV